MNTSHQAKATAGTARPQTLVGRAVRVASLAAAVAGLATAFACSSSKSSAGTPCNENPWECGAGQVCWPTSNSSFACLSSGTGQAGDTCALTLGAATCSDGLNCLATTASGNGICSPYCDLTGSSHPCAATAICESGELPDGGTGGSFNVCVPLGDDGGDDSGVTTTGEAGVSEAGASEAGATVHDGGASDASTSVSEAGASDASADVVVGE